MWGVKTHQNREAILIAAKIIFYETQHEIKYGFDQKMLNTHFTPLAINDAVLKSFKLQFLVFYFNWNIFQ